MCVCDSVRDVLEKHGDRPTIAAAEEREKRQDMRDTQLQDVKRLKMCYP